MTGCAGVDMESKETLGERMKQYEQDNKLPADQFIVARLDGRCFSKFTSSFTKPYDECFARAMQLTPHDTDLVVSQYR